MLRLRKLNMRDGGGGGEGVEETDFAEKPPTFEKQRAARKKCPKNFSLKSLTRDFSKTSSVLWWCFQLLFFDLGGFFSRINTQNRPLHDPFMDLHAFPLRIKENPDKPLDAILQVGF